MRRARLLILATLSLSGCATPTIAPPPAPTPQDWSTALARATIPTLATQTPTPPSLLALALPSEDQSSCHDAIGRHLQWVVDLDRALEDCNLDFRPSALGCQDLIVLLGPTQRGWQAQARECMATADLGGHSLESIAAAAEMGEDLIPRLAAMESRIARESRR